MMFHILCEILLCVCVCVCVRVCVCRCLVHLSRYAANVGIFAPDKTQMHVINHRSGDPDSEGSRWVVMPDSDSACVWLPWTAGTCW